MRKSFLVLLVGMILIVGACTPKDSFTIQGKITGLSDGTIMELVPGATHKQEKPVAEAREVFLSRGMWKPLVCIMLWFKV